MLVTSTEENKNIIIYLNNSQELYLKYGFWERLAIFDRQM